MCVCVLGRLPFSLHLGASFTANEVFHCTDVPRNRMNCTSSAQLIERERERERERENVTMIRMAVASR